MTNLGEIFENLDTKYDEFYEEFYKFNKKMTKSEKENLLYKITQLKEEIRVLERKIKDMYIAQ